MPDTSAKLNMEELLAIRSDVFRFIPMHKMKYDLIFADPPYDSQHYDLLVNLIFENNLLKEDGMLVVEHNKFIDFKEHPRFVEQRRYGKVNFSFFK